MKQHGYRNLILILLILCAARPRAGALPQGATVVHGDVAISGDQKTMAIRAGDRAIINFRNFDISRGEAVSFLQPGPGSQVLGRITDGKASQISGQLNSNGRVVLVNPSGIFFKNGSSINVGALIAAAGKISDLDFKTGRSLFTDLQGRVVNNGVISANEDVHLLGNTVVNHGVIQSKTGMVCLSVGNDILVGERDGNIFLSRDSSVAGDPQKPTKETVSTVKNTGTIKGRRVYLGAGDVYASVTHQTGQIHGDKVRIDGGKNGKALISGVIDTSSKTPGDTGGTIEITGGQVSLKGAKIIANGDSGGGQVFIGGEWQGMGTLPHSTHTTLDENTVIQANALRMGSGGKIVLWSDGDTTFNGKIFACAAGSNQQGGQVETSGKISLSVGPLALVSTQSASGAIGTWLLDPTNLTIDASGTGTLTGAGDQTVSASAINNAGATVTLSATQDIIINQPVTMTKSDAGLIVNAGKNLWVKSPISTKNGAITLTADFDQNGTGWLKVDSTASLSTAGNVITLTVNHSTAVSSDGIDLFGNLDTRISTSTYTRVVSTIQLLGSNSTGAINIGLVKAELGQNRNTGGAYGELLIKADEINFSGGLNSFKGSGAIQLEQANAATSVKLLSANDATPKQLDLSTADLAAISSDFIGLWIGRNDSTAAFVIGDSGSTQSLTMDRGVGGATFVRLRSGALGFTISSPSKFLNTSYVDLSGNSLLITQPMSVPSGPVSVAGLGNIDTEITEGVASPGVLQLRPSQLKFLSDSSAGLSIGNEASASTTRITVKDAITLSSVAGTPAGNLILRTGGALIIQAPIDVGAKGLSLLTADLQLAAGIATQIKGNSNLLIAPSTGAAGAAAIRDMEIYADNLTPTGDILKILNQDITTLAGNFPGSITMGRGGQMKGGVVRISGPIDVRGKLVSTLDFTATDTLQINTSVEAGLNRSGAKQGIVLQGREIDLNPSTGGVIGLGNLTIQPVSNANQTTNPINRPMFVGAAVNDPTGLTITSDDYSKIGNTFQKIFLGRALLTGDLSFKDAPFSLKADTEVLCLGTVKFETSVGDSSAADGQRKSLWVRSLELNINQSVHNLFALQINIIPGGQTGGRKIIVNGANESLTNPTNDMSMDLTRKDLGYIQGSTVTSLVIGFDGQAFASLSGATSNAAIEVEANWLLPTNTELRSSNQIFSTSAASTTPPPAPVFGSILIKGAVNGGGYSLSLISDSGLMLSGGPASISNISSLTIAPFSRSVEVRMLDPQANPNALILSPQFYAALGDSIDRITAGRTDSVKNLTLVTALSLVVDTTFNTGASANIFAAIEGNKSLTIAAGGITNLTNSIGENNPLKDLTITYGKKSGEKTLIGTTGGSPIKIRTSGNQQFSEAVELQSPCTFETAGLLTLALPFNAGVHDLTIFANEIVLNGGNASVSGSGNLKIAAGTPETPTVFNSSNTSDITAQLDLTQLKLMAFALNQFSSFTLGRLDASASLTVEESLVLLQPTTFQTGNGPLTIQNKIDGPQNLTFRSCEGDIVIQGALGSVAELGQLSFFSCGATKIKGDISCASLFTDVGGSTEISTAFVGSSGFQTFGDPVHLANNVSLTSLNLGSISINVGVSGDFDLDIKTAGVTTLRGTSSLSRLETDSPGTVDLSGIISTRGTQIYGESVWLSQNTTLIGTTVQFNGSIVGNNFDLTVTGNAQLNQSISGVHDLLISEDTLLGAGIVSSSGSQNYRGMVTLAGDRSLQSSNASDITLNQGVNGSFNLKIVAGGKLIVTGASSLFSLTAESLGGSFLSGEILTTKGQSYNSAVYLTGNTQLHSSGDGALTLTGAVSGDFDLSLGTDGLTDLRGPIASASVHTESRGRTLVNANIITSGEQLYRNAITIDKTVLFKSSTGSPILFESPIDGSGSISIETNGKLIVKGDTGSQVILKSFSASAKEIEVASISAQNLTLNSLQPLILTGAQYLASECISLNRNVPSPVSGESTIIKKQGSLNFKGSTLLMGEGQKLNALTGSILMDFSTVETGDIAAGSSILLNISNLNLIARQASPLGGQAIPDNGLSFVSPEITVNGRAMYAGTSQGPLRAFWNTKTGVISGVNNLAHLSGAQIAPNEQLLTQFALTSGRGIPLQPLAIRPLVNPQPVPPSTIPVPTTPGSAEPIIKFPYPMKLLSGSKHAEPTDTFEGIWVRRSLEINGRWTSHGANSNEVNLVKKEFLEL